MALSPPSILDSMQNVPRLAARILGPDAFLDVVVHVGEVDGGVWGAIGGAGGHPNNPDRVLGGNLSGSGEDWVDEVGEEEWRKVIDANLELVALHRLRALRRDHNTGVIVKHVEAAFLRKELLGGSFDSGQVVEY